MLKCSNWLTLESLSLITNVSSGVFIMQIKIIACRLTDINDRTAFLGIICLGQQ
jgi:hypothetical protein